MVESESHQSSPWPVTRAKFLQKSRLQMSHNLKCVLVQISESLVQDILKLSETSLTHVLFGSVLFHLQVFLYFRLFFFFHYCLASLIHSLRKCFVRFS